MSTGVHTLNFHFPVSDDTANAFVVIGEICKSLLHGLLFHMQRANEIELFLKNDCAFFQISSFG